MKGAEPLVGWHEPEPAPDASEQIYEGRRLLEAESSARVRTSGFFVAARRMEQPNEELKPTASQSIAVERFHDHVSSHSHAPSRRRRGLTPAR